MDSVSIHPEKYKVQERLAVKAEEVSVAAERKVTVASEPIPDMPSLII